MKNAYIKVAVITLAFMTFLFCSCSNTDGTTDNVEKHTFSPATYEKNISGSDVFDNGWYYESLDIHTKVMVSKLDSAKGVTWSVYCSVNSTNSPAPTSDMLKISYKTQ